MPVAVYNEVGRPSALPLDLPAADRATPALRHRVAAIVRPDPDTPGAVGAEG